jgi:hypothetical protein
MALNHARRIAPTSRMLETSIKILCLPLSAVPSDAHSAACAMPHVIKSASRVVSFNAGPPGYCFGFARGCLFIITKAGEILGSNQASRPRGREKQPN